MANVLVVFESKYGQAEKIAEHVAEMARRAGHDAKAIRTSSAPALTVSDSDAVVVVAPIYFGRHHELVEPFLRLHADELAKRPSAFVSVSGAAANADPSVRAGAEKIARDFVARLGYDPRLVITAGGAMAYPRYGAVLRFVTWFISRRRGGPTDTSRVYEMTDWKALEAALVPFLERLDAPAVDASVGDTASW